MKIIIAFIFLLLSQTFLYAQNVEREKVVIEMSTCTYCPYCPGASAAADQLAEEGKDVAIIEYHNTAQGPDPFVNPYSLARISYYGMNANPTARFDGLNPYAGGQACPPPFTSPYPIYSSRYDQRKAITSPYTISFGGENTSGNNYQVIITLVKVGDVSTENSVVHFVVTESNIQHNWLCMPEVDFLNRLMVPDQNGTPLVLTNNEQQITLNFTLDATWDTDNIEFVCFIQSNTDKTIHQAITSTYGNLTPILTAQFIASDTTVCETSPVNFTDLSTGSITSRSWTFPGGTPGSSTQINPTVTYNEAGSYDVTLKVYSNNGTDELTKPGYIIVSEGLPSIPSQPEGEDQLCKNPPNTSYSTTGSGNTLTFDWDLKPTNAGILLSDGNSTTSVNWFNSFLGTATLAVKGINGCGESQFSDTLYITLSSAPIVYDLFGGGALCEGEEGVEIGLSDSEAGVTYQLYTDDQPMGAPIPGTGDPISFGLISTAGEYTASGMNSTTLCDSEMDNTVSVVVNPLPATYQITGGGPYCEGMEAIPVGQEDSQSDCEYELFCNGASTGIIVPGTGEAITFGQFTTLGTYHVIATNTETSCTNTMTGTTEITLAPQPEIPLTPQGPVYVDLYYSDQTEYETSGSANSDMYDWLLQPSEAGTVEVLDATHCLVTWNTDFLGQAEIRTKGVNDCGESAWSEPFIVTILNTVGFQAISDQIGIKVLPNPSDGVFTIQLRSEREEIISVRIISALNSVAFEENSILVNGSLTRTIDLSHVTDGIYFLYVETGQSTYIRKLVFN